MDESEHTYYLDSDSFVTNRRVKLADVEYDLADIKWVGVEERVPGFKLGSVELPAYAVLIAAIWLTGLLVILLARAFLPEYISDYAAPAVAVAILLAAAPILQWWGARSRTKFLLGVSGSFGVQYPMASKERERLSQIAEAIKHATRDRYANLQQTKPPARENRRTSTSAR